MIDLQYWMYWSKFYDLSIYSDISRFFFQMQFFGGKWSRGEENEKPATDIFRTFISAFSTKAKLAEDIVFVYSQEEDIVSVYRARASSG